MTTETYEIVIRGTLGESLESAIEGFRVERVEHGQTHLIGSIVDQAQLLGVVAQLRDLTIDIVSINPLHDDEH